MLEGGLCVLDEWVSRLWGNGSLAPIVLATVIMLLLILHCIIRNSIGRLLPVCDTFEFHVLCGWRIVDGWETRERQVPWRRTGRFERLWRRRRRSRLLRCARPLSLERHPRKSVHEYLDQHLEIGNKFGNVSHNWNLVWSCISAGSSKFQAYKKDGYGNSKR